MQTHNNITYKLDAETINTLRKRMNVFSNYIDPFRITQVYRRFISRGRQVVQIKDGTIIWIVVERDQSTRYIINRSHQNASGGKKKFQEMVDFQGCKMEAHKYIQCGQFHNFQLVRLKEELSFRYQPEFAFTNIKDVSFAKANEGYHLLAFQNTEKIVYFDNQLNIVQQERMQKIEESQNDNLYFGLCLSETILADIQNGNKISSKGINYFFKRLAFSCTSRQWLVETKRPKLVIDEVINWAKLPISLDKINQQVLSQGWFLKICPIYQYQCQHFILIAMQIQNGSFLKVYQFDSLGATLIKQPRQGLNIQTVAHLNGPKQRYGLDCGVFCLIYTLLLTHKYEILPLSSLTLSILCNQQKIDNTMNQLRASLAQSYRTRNSHFLEDVLLALRE